MSMKKMTVLMTVLAAVGLANANMLTNGDFESGTAGWAKWWNSGNAGFPVDDPLDPVPLPEGNECGGVWWSDCGIVQTIPIGPGKYEFGGKMLHGAVGAAPLGNNRVAFVQAEMKGPDATTVWWVQNFMIDATSPTNEWISGTGEGVIDNTTAGASYVTLNLFALDQNGPHTGAGVVRFDNIYFGPLGIASQAKFPVPADGALVPPSTNVLSWQSPDPNNPADTTLCDVYLEVDDGDPNFQNAPIAANLAGDSLVLSSVGVTLAEGTTYTWRVDCTDPHGDPNTGEPVTTQGPIWTFTTTADNPPVVEAGVNQYLWLGMDDGDGDPTKVTFTLNGQVVDDGASPLTTLWSLAYSEQDPTTTVTITDPASPVTTVTLTGGARTGLYRFQLDADDAFAHDDDTVEVIVYGSACEAAQGDPDDHYHTYAFIGDTNNDCQVNLEDLAIMAATWLDCLSAKLGCMP